MFEFLISEPQFNSETMRPPKFYQNDPESEKKKVFMILKF